MTDMTMIERVARALYSATPFKETAGGYEEQSAGYQSLCRILARAAIEAMREPTKAMDMARYKGHGYAGPADEWQAMIDAALSEHPNKD